MISFSLHYIYWHYTKALSDLSKIIGNFVWFVLQLFSVSLLCRTFFMPFKRIQDAPTSILHPEAFIEAVMVNTIMRLVGMVLRAILILCGLLGVVSVLCAGICFFVAWILSPFLVLFLLGFGAMLIVFG